METINNVASAAAKVVWGTPESHEEPASGIKGNTAKGEPYDAGNMEADEAQKLVNPKDEKPVVDQPNTAGASAANTTENVDKLVSGDDHDSPLHTPAVTSVGEHHVQSQSSRPDEEPVPEAELKKPGPKPLEVLAREHGGDAGNTGKEPDTTPARPAGDTETGPSGEGSGEKHIKSTGFAAEGGDFDAANAGAGREADRLVEEHATSPSAGGSQKHDNDHATKHASNSSDGNGEKRSLKEKIKAKLHRH